MRDDGSGKNEAKLPYAAHPKIRDCYCYSVILLVIRSEIVHHIGTPAFSIGPRHACPIAAAKNRVFCIPQYCKFLPAKLGLFP